MGFRVHALGSRVAQYGDGSYAFAGRDSLSVAWSNGYTGLSLSLHVDSVAMRGFAEVWTDNGGGERASIVLRPTACPPE